MVEEVHDVLYVAEVKLVQVDLNQLYINPHFNLGRITGLYELIDQGIVAALEGELVDFQIGNLDQIIIH